MIETDRPKVPADAPDLRERIVRASVSLIEEQGLTALSMREVARRAGVSHQAPYHHFADREAILGAIAQEGFVMLCAKLEQATADATLPSYVRIGHAGRAYVSFALAHPAHFRVMFRPELVNLDRCPGAEAEGDRAFGVLTQIVSEAIADGLPSDPGVDAFILLSWSVGHGLACLALDGPLARKMPSQELGPQIERVCDAFTTLMAASMPKALSTSARVRPSSKAPAAQKSGASRKKG